MSHVLRCSEVFDHVVEVTKVPIDVSSNVGGFGGCSPIEEAVVECRHLVSFGE